MSIGRNDELPRLYKFMPLNGSFRFPSLEAMIKSHCIYVSTFQQLNDPLECLLTQKNDWSSHQSERFSHHESEADHRLFLLNEIRMKAEGFRIFSLTENPTNLRMWIEYADKLRGVCLEMRLPVNSYRNAAYLPLEVPPSQSLLFKVCYSSQPQFLLNYEDLPALGRMHESVRQHTMLRDVGRAAFTKHTSWSHEEEWRLIDMGGTEETLRFQQPIVSHVILGPAISDENAVRIRTLCREHSIEVANAILDGYDVRVHRPRPILPE